VSLASASYTLICSIGARNGAEDLGPFSGVHQQLQLTVLIRERRRMGMMSRRGRCSYRSSAAFRRTGVIELVQKGEPDRKKGVVASAKRPHRCVRSSPHGRQNSPGWLKAGKWLGWVAPAAVDCGFSFGP
jgi:hypothetical protein